MDLQASRYYGVPVLVSGCLISGGSGFGVVECSDAVRCYYAGLCLLWGGGGQFFFEVMCNQNACMVRLQYITLDLG